MQPGCLLDADGIQHNEANGQCDGDGLDRQVGQNDEIRSQADQGEGGFEEEGEPDSKPGHRSHQGPHTLVDEDIGAAGFGHGRCHF